MRLPSIEDLPDVSEELLAALNHRFRLIEANMPGLVGTRQDQRRTPASAVPAGTPFRVSDRRALYIADGNQWVYVAGIMRDDLGKRPSDLASNDAGFLFEDTAPGYTYLWTGRDWAVVNPFAEQVTIKRTISGATQPTLLIDSGLTAKTRIGKIFNDARMSYAVNLTFDGANYNLDDTGYYGVLWQGNAGSATAPALRIYVATPGANPRTLSTFLDLQNNGCLAVGMVASGSYPFEVSGKINFTTGLYRAGVKQIDDSGHWLPHIHRNTLANLPAGLGAGDADYLFYVTDYRHLLRWTGSAWEWGPGEEGSGEVRMFLAAPNPTTGWQLCDGSTVARLNPDGTTTNVTTPNYSTAAYLKGANAYAAPAAASGAVADESTHTHGVSIASGGPSATSPMSGTGGTQVPTSAHTHLVSGTSGAGSAHGHGPGTLELANGQMMLYYRR